MTRERVLTLVKLPNGETAKFYVDMPDDLASVELQFSGTLAKKYLETDEKDVTGHCEYVLGRLARLVDDARMFFLGQPAPQLLHGKRLPSFLRVVK